MPRDSSGNYVLPAGNPVVGGTPITTSWANPTMADVAAALTDSLSRSGNGGMLVPFKFADGTLGAPGMAWGSEPASGFFRAGGNDMQAVIAGVPRMRWTASSVDVWDTGLNAWLAIVGPGGSNFAFVNAANTFVGNNLFNAPGTLGGSAAATWTGQHVFSSPGTTAAPIVLRSSFPNLVWVDEDSLANERRWDILANGGDLTFRTVDDGITTARNWLSVDRAAIAVTALNFGNATDNPTYNFLGTGAGTASGPWSWAGAHTFTSSVEMRAANPGYTFYETDAAADAHYWWTHADAATYRIEVVNDVFSLAKPALAIARTANVLTAINFGNATDNPTYNFLGTGAGSVSGLWTFNALVHISSASGRQDFSSTVAIANQKRWLQQAEAGGQFTFYTANDDGSGGFKVWLQAARSGTAVTSLTFGNASDNPTYNFLGTGAVTSNGLELGYRSLNIRSASTSFSLTTVDNGKAVIFSGGPGNGLTLNGNFAATGYIVTIINAGTGSLQIIDDLAGSIYWFNGGGALAVGNRTLAIGGVCTIHMPDSAGNAYIWGVGLS